MPDLKAPRSNSFWLFFGGLMGVGWGNFLERGKKKMKIKKRWAAGIRSWMFVSLNGMGWPSLMPLGELQLHFFYLSLTVHCVLHFSHILRDRVHVKLSSECMKTCLEVIFIVLLFTVISSFSFFCGKKMSTKYFSSVWFC